LLLDNIYETLRLSREDAVTRENASRIMYELMKGHGYEDAWDNDEFNNLFDVF